MIGSRLTSVTVEGYTSIRSARVELGRLNVLVGPNGAGKSNFVNALELLGRIANDNLQLFVGLRGGAATLLHGGTKGKAAISLRVESPPDSYEARLVPGARDDFVFDSETISSADSAAAVSTTSMTQAVPRRSSCSPTPRTTSRSPQTRPIWRPSY
ncbi:AAA family ATPase [Frankia sp. Cas3]|uniref:AAA family ATPase n=1 Tax=Frankia sp. Cas3 TaxID=3073926 RepID=UPI002AD21858|nr:AAA family ATPase [Frankia sp. Cas3]